ncbi:hypothetical protein [Francisella frigiditurris]|uniref:Uncharacterized protein n=1 Tax=Francisella frigiditurris TaxID=1542390 RepID=A0A1J0KUP8_9GAMM|nr:hypothetical protein [Francisella frigiditurris]APC97366.1 hypothetical protein KX01_921 [Francisella frigiditurris]
MQLALKYDPQTRYKVIEKIEELENYIGVPRNYKEANKLIELQSHKTEYFDALVDKNLLTILNGITIYKVISKEEIKAI